jgi:hypothetical protein
MVLKRERWKKATFIGIDIFLIFCRVKSYHTLLLNRVIQYIFRHGCTF